MRNLINWFIGKEKYIYRCMRVYKPNIKKLTLCLRAVTTWGIFIWGNWKFSLLPHIFLKYGRN